MQNTYIFNSFDLAEAVRQCCEWLNNLVDDGWHSPIFFETLPCLVLRIKSWYFSPPTCPFSIQTYLKSHDWSKIGQVGKWLDLNRVEIAQGGSVTNETLQSSVMFDEVRARVLEYCELPLPPSRLGHLIVNQFSLSWSLKAGLYHNWLCIKLSL